MQALDEGIVQYKHHGREPPGPLLAPEEHLANIASVLDFRVA